MSLKKSSQEKLNSSATKLPPQQKKPKRKKKKQPKQTADDADNYASIEMSPGSSKENGNDNNREMIAENLYSYDTLPPITIQGSSKFTPGSDEPRSLKSSGRKGSRRQLDYSLPPSRERSSSLTLDSGIEFRKSVGVPGGHIARQHDPECKPYGEHVPTSEYIKPYKFDVREEDLIGYAMAKDTEKPDWDSRFVCEESLKRPNSGGSTPSVQSRSLNRPDSGSSRSLQSRRSGSSSRSLQSRSKESSNIDRRQVHTCPTLPRASKEDGNNSSGQEKVKSATHPPSTAPASSTSTRTTDSFPIDSPQTYTHSSYLQTSASVGTLPRVVDDTPTPRSVSEWIGSECLPPTPLPRDLLDEAARLWSNLVSELRESGSDIQYSELSDVAGISKPTAEIKSVVFFLAVLSGYKADWEGCKRSLFRHLFPLLKFVKEADPAAVSVRRLRKALKLQSKELSSASVASMRNVHPSAAKLLRWVLAFSAVSKLVVSADRHRKNVQRKAHEGSGGDTFALPFSETASSDPSDPRDDQEVASEEYRDDFGNDDTADGEVEGKRE